MEAKKPRVFEETLIFIKKDFTEIKKRMCKCRKSVQKTSRFQSRMPWLQIGSSQKEAKGETKDFNGSEEAKGFGGEINFYSKKILLI